MNENDLHRAIQPRAKDSNPRRQTFMAGSKALGRTMPAEGCVRYHVKSLALWEMMHTVLKHEEVPHSSVPGPIENGEATMVITVDAKYAKVVEDRVQEWYEGMHKIHTEVWAHHDEWRTK